MASAASKPKASSLPCKKRKASNASSSMSSNGITVEAASSSHRSESVAAEAASTRSISESRLPSKKRKESHDERARKGSYDLPFFGEDHAIRIRKGSVDCGGESFVHLPLRKASHDSSLLPLDDLLSLGHPPEQSLREETETSSVTGNDRNNNQEATTSALDHLDALHHNESNKKLPAAAVAVAVAEAPMQTKGGDDSSHETFASSGHRLLMEAIMMSNASETKSGGSAPKQQQQQVLDHLPNPAPYRERLDSFTVRDRLDSFTARDRLDSFIGRERLDSFTAPTGRDRLDSFTGRRDRLESWGGMSDLSVPLGSSSDSMVATAMAAASNLHHGYLMEDPDDPAVQAAAAAIAFGHQQHHDGDNDRKPSAIPSKISLQRDRLNSTASLGDSSFPNFPLVVDGIDVTGDIQAFVAAAMASVGDQLEELAGAMEEIAAESLNFEEFKREMGLESDGGSSAASPLIGAVSDAATRRPRSWSTSSGRISVDLEAVQAAVDAAEAASGTLGLSSARKMAPPPQKPSAVTSSSVAQSTVVRSRAPRRHLPLKRGRTESNTSLTTSDERLARGFKSDSNGIDRIRERARAAAGYVPPMGSSAQSQKNLPPLKKRIKRTSPDTPATATATSAAAMPTPKVSNRTLVSVSETPLPPLVVSSSEVKPTKQGGQASQKWEGMYTCLLEFAEERLLEETKHLSEDEKRVWIWDGNVPTNYKTKDGKALGRWVNNQRSAKSKGTLKEDREQRLIDAGLKWSVLACNSWNEMLQELSTYIKEQHRQGKVWDGNVPTNYQIKTRPNGGFNGEDKNLGRWVNRQRSMYQAGKLRKDRQLALENVGLKWSMLATTSWDSMFDTLKEYVDQQKKGDIGTWDGNVPANYRTNDNPPRALGRWINRQRSSFAKNKLKKECVDKLNELGLKWSVHHRHGEHEDIDDADYGEFMYDDAPSDSKGDSSGKENAEKSLEVEREAVIQAI